MSLFNIFNKSPDKYMSEQEKYMFQYCQFDNDEEAREIILKEVRVRNFKDFFESDIMHYNFIIGMYMDYFIQLFTHSDEESDEERECMTHMISSIIIFMYRGTDEVLHNLDTMIELAKHMTCIDEKDDCSNFEHILGRFKDDICFLGALQNCRDYLNYSTEMRYNCACKLLDILRHLKNQDISYLYSRPLIPCTRAREWAKNICVNHYE